MGNLSCQIFKLPFKTIRGKREGKMAQVDKNTNHGLATGWNLEPNRQKPGRRSQISGSHGSGSGFSLRQHGREETLPGWEAPKWPEVPVTRSSINGRRYKPPSGEEL